MAHGEKLVLVSGGSGAAVGYQPDGNAFTGGSAGDVGIWCLDVKDALTTTTANAHCDGVGNFLFMNSGVLQAARFQFTQQKTSGPPTCSPILHAGDLKKVEYRIFVNEIAATATWTPTAANNTMFAIKLIQLGSGLAGGYGYQTDPQNDSLENVGKVYYFEYTSDASGTAIEICDAIRDSINGDPTSPWSTNANGNNTIVVTAKNMESDFQALDVSTGTASWTGGVANYKAVGTDGEGNGRQVVDAEKSNESYQGYHNRIWLPSAPERFAVASQDYDSIVYTFDHGPGSYNARMGNQINDAAKYGDYVVEHYVDEGWTDGGSNINEILPIANGVNEVIDDFGW